MLKIKKNKLKTQQILITEPVYMRIAFTTRYGEIDPNNPDNVLVWLNYKAWGETSYNANNGAVNIDGIIDEIIKSIDKTKNYGWVEFNELFKAYMIKTLGLEDSDVEIVGL